MTKNIKFSAASRIAFITLTAALLLPLANAQAPAKSSTDSMHGSMSDSSTMSPDGMDMTSMMKTMHEKMSSMQMTGNTDVDFAMMMRMHHQGAIQMGEAELKNGKEPKMRKMAKDIISAQKKEIAQLDTFLAKHGQTADKMNK